MQITEEILNNTQDFEQTLCQLGQAVLEIERDAINNLLPRLGHTFAKACQLILRCKGRVVVIGMGKSGHIGNKIAATLASTGTPAFFVHPGEASHGDLGMITASDVVITLSNSGTTDEILTILPIIKRLNVPLISMLGQPVSPLGEASAVVLDVSVDKEACPLGLAPTASTSAALAMGDALSVALLSARGFTQDDFARSHPSGRLGRRLLLHVEDIMHSGIDIPVVKLDTPLSEALIEMTTKRLGMTVVVDAAGKACGIFTDGDLRRIFDGTNLEAYSKIETIMTREYKSIHANALAIDALQVMEDNQITSLIVLDEADKLVGVVHMHDMLKAKVV